MYTSTPLYSITLTTTMAGKKRLRNKTTQQKRNNVFVMKNRRKSAFALFIAVAMATTILSPIATRAFHLRQLTTSQQVTALHSTRAPIRRSRTTTIKSSSSSSSITVVEAVQPLRPESSMSQKRRDTVLRESKENNGATGMRSVDSALEGIDAQVLELLSEEFLYPSSSSNSNNNNKYSDPNKLSNERPYGRPELVPGAMTWSSMKRYQQKREIMNHLVDKAKEKSSTTTTASSSVSNRNPNSSNSATNMIRHDLQPRLNVPSREVSRRESSAKPKKTSASIRGSSTSSSSSSSSTSKRTAHIDLPESTTMTTSTGGTEKKKVGRKSKNKKKILPKQRKVKTTIEKENDIYYDDDEVYRANDPNKFIASRARPGRRKSDAAGNGQGGGETNNLELRKYYATDLLTPEQEYSIGQKIQLMISCEQVHEGLAISELRLPTIEEWAQACGYTNERNEGDDNNNEIINDLVEKQIRPIGSESIFKKIDPNMFVGNGLAHTVGVGRGRGRAKLPPPMKLTEDVYKLDRKTGKKVGGSKAKPVNRGTVHDFVDMILDGREAKQLMVQSNMRLVLSIARKYTKVGVSLQDLVQEGSLGLSRAAEKFDPTRGFKFSTYASWWIQQAVFRSIAYHSRIIRLPVHIHNMMNRVRKVKTNLQQGLGRAPTDEEMADALDMPTSKFKRMIRLTRRSISLEQPQYKQNPKDHGHEGDDSIGDMMSTGTDFGNNLDEENVSPEKSVDRSLFHQDLREMLLNLNEGEQKVIGLRYGLEDGITRTVTAVATKINKSPAWVRSQESKGLRRLRRPWYEKKLLEHQQSLLQN